MAKTKTRYVCQECGRSAPKALGRCPQCGAWDSMVEEIIVEDTKSALSQVLPGLGGFSTPKRLNEIDGDSEERIPVPIEEFSRVLGGGVVPGSIVLIGGDPGIGKSTLMLQMTMQMADGNTVLYVSGEESERQIKMRALRLLRGDQGQSGELPEDLYLVTETNLDMILQHVQAIQPRLLVVDSIQNGLPAGPRIQRRVGFAGAGKRLQAARTGQNLRHCRLRDRPCHQTGRDRRAAGSGAYCGYRALP